MSVAVRTTGDPEVFDFATIDAHEDGPWRYLRGVLHCDDTCTQTSNDTVIIGEKPHGGQEPQLLGAIQRQ